MQVATTLKWFKMVQVLSLKWFQIGSDFLYNKYILYFHFTYYLSIPWEWLKIIQKWCCAIYALKMIWTGSHSVMELVKNNLVLLSRLCFKWLPTIIELEILYISILTSNFSVLWSRTGFNVVQKVVQRINSVSWRATEHKFDIQLNNSVNFL